jgi:hypothetical protein
VPLVKAGYDASTVCSQDLTGTQAPELWEIIQGEERFLITEEKKFGNIQKYSLKDLAKKVTAASHGKIRIRKTFRNFEY